MEGSGGMALRTADERAKKVTKEEPVIPNWAKARKKSKKKTTKASVVAIAKKIKSGKLDRRTGKAGVRKTSADKVSVVKGNARKPKEITNRVGVGATARQGSAGGGGKEEGGASKMKKKTAGSKKVDGKGKGGVGALKGAKVGSKVVAFAEIRQGKGKENGETVLAAAKKSSKANGPDANEPSKRVKWRESTISGANPRVAKNAAEAKRESAKVGKGEAGKVEKTAEGITKKVGKVAAKDRKEEVEAKGARSKDDLELLRRFGEMKMGEECGKGSKGVEVGRKAKGGVRERNSGVYVVLPSATRAYASPKLANPTKIDGANGPLKGSKVGKSAKVKTEAESGLGNAVATKNKKTGEREVKGTNKREDEGGKKKKTSGEEKVGVKKGKGGGDEARKRRSNSSGVLKVAKKGDGGKEAKKPKSKSSKVKGPAKKKTDPKRKPKVATKGQNVCVTRGACYSSGDCSLLCESCSSFTSSDCSTCSSSEDSFCSASS